MTEVMNEFAGLDQEEATATKALSEEYGAEFTLREYKSSGKHASSSGASLISKPVASCYDVF
jgi:hypothetical protein